MKWYLKQFSASLFLLGYMTKTLMAAEVFVLLTSNIIPYTTCTEGIREALSDYSLIVYNIEEDLDKGRDLLSEASQEKPSTIIAVGPQATFLVSEKNYPFPRVFCMVLNPEKLLGKERLYPGVSLNIPPSFQLQTIKKAFPNRRKIGVFYSPAVNQKLIDFFLQSAETLDLILVPFPIMSPREIPEIIESRQFPIDVLLVIPDEQIKSEKIIKYLIKESLYRKIPVVGYNSWFAKNGATLSFIIDYRDVGLQTGRMALELLSERQMDEILVGPPERIKISIDVKTARKLDIQISNSMLQQADEVLR
jgi:putative ABC transport system substrate-binding protein